MNAAFNTTPARFGRLILNAMVLALLLMPWASIAGDAPPTPAPPTAVEAAVPAARQANSLAVITIEGEIDRWTARSVARRIALAEKSGADAIVIDLHTPGGEVGAVLEITNAIKGSQIANTVAWINHDAYSGGAIIAVSCREIVTNDPGALGDAFAVTPTYHEKLGRGGLRGLTPEERTKILPVLLSDVIDSARRGGYDEFVVQAMVIDGIELWLAEDATTGERYAINRAEYQVLFGDDDSLFIDGKPIQGKPMLAGVTGARYESSAEGPVPTGDVPIQTDAASPPSSEPDAGDADGAGGATNAPPPTPAERKFRPASKEVEDIAGVFESGSRRGDLEIEAATQRPFFTEKDRGRFTLIGYITDGHNAVVMRTGDMQQLGFSTRVVRSDAELLAFFGASSLARHDMSWSENLAGFMTNPVVRGVLIAVFLLGLFLEMVSPGLVAPSIVALGALFALLAPPVLFGMAGWWEIAAIVGGIAFMAAEIFVLPGFGFFGVVGIVSLFIGLVGTFIPDTPGLAGSAQTQSDMLWGILTVLLSGATSFVGMYFIGKNFGSLPLLNRLVLTTQSGDFVEHEGSDPMLAAMGSLEDDQPAIGDFGEAITPLRPSGTGEFDGRVIDVVAGIGLIEPGTRIVVVSSDQFRVVVEAAEGSGA